MMLLLHVCVVPVTCLCASVCVLFVVATDVLVVVVAVVDAEVVVASYVAVVAVVLAEASSTADGSNISVRYTAADVSSATAA